MGASKSCYGSIPFLFAAFYTLNKNFSIVTTIDRNVGRLFDIPNKFYFILAKKCFCVFFIYELVGIELDIIRFCVVLYAVNFCAGFRLVVYKLFDTSVLCYVSKIFFAPLHCLLSSVILPFIVLVILTLDSVAFLLSYRDCNSSLSNPIIFYVAKTLLY